MLILNNSWETNSEFLSKFLRGSSKFFQHSQRIGIDLDAADQVHRDEHWLLRDLALQAEGPRLAGDGTRDLQRMVRRRTVSDSWESAPGCFGEITARNACICSRR